MFYCPLCIVIPSHFNFSTLGVQAVNGSSATGHCSDVTQHLNSLSTCSSPASSVLFDGVIPTLTALDGNTWARQLMILQRPLFGSSSFNIYSSFTNAWIRRVEVVLFNCPQWGTAVNRIGIEFLYSGNRNPRYAYPTVFSCDSLVKVCVPLDTTSAETAIRLYFSTNSYYKIHLAEVSFYENSSPCPPFTIIPGNWTPPQGTGICGYNYYSKPSQLHASGWPPNYTYWTAPPPPPPPSSIHVCWVAIYTPATFFVRIVPTHVTLYNVMIILSTKKLLLNYTIS